MIHCGHTFCTPCLKKFYMYVNYHIGTAESDVPCASNWSNSSIALTDFQSITRFSLTLLRRNQLKLSKMEDNIQSKMLQSFCLENFKEFKKKHICVKTLKGLTKSPAYLFVCSITIEWSIFTVRPTRYKCVNLGLWLQSLH